MNTLSVSFVDALERVVDLNVGDAGKFPLSAANYKWEVLCRIRRNIHLNTLSPEAVDFKSCTEPCQAFHRALSESIELKIDLLKPSATSHGV